MATTRKQQFNFKGEIRDESLLIANFGDATMVVDGIFELSGIVYCPKYELTLIIEGDGVIALRGICSRVVIKKMSGNCKLDLRDLTCKELRCESIRKKSRIITGKVRVVTKANLFDDSVLHVSEKALVTSASTADNAQIIQSDSDVVLS